MKKYIVLMAAALVSLTSCSVYTDVEAGGTAVEEMAGTWYVTMDIYATDDIYADDVESTYVESFGPYTFATYNTASNSSTEMWVSDQYSYWGFRVKVDIDLASKTFSIEDYESEVLAGYYYADDDVDEEYPIPYYYEYGISILDGVITPDGAVSPTGADADAISFWLKIDTYNTHGPTSEDYYHIHGYRYSGFE